MKCVFAIFSILFFLSPSQEEKIVCNITPFFPPPPKYQHVRFGDCIPINLTYTGRNLRIESTHLVEHGGFETIELKKNTSFSLIPPNSPHLITPDLFHNENTEYNYDTTTHYFEKKNEEEIALCSPLLCITVPKSPIFYLRPLYQFPTIKHPCSRSHYLPIGFKSDSAHPIGLCIHTKQLKKDYPTITTGPTSLLYYFSDKNIFKQVIIGDYSPEVHWANSDNLVSMEHKFPSAPSDPPSDDPAPFIFYSNDLSQYIKPDAVAFSLSHNLMHILPHPERVYSIKTPTRVYSLLKEENGDYMLFPEPGERRGGGHFDAYVESYREWVRERRREEARRANLGEGGNEIVEGNEEEGFMGMEVEKDEEEIAMAMEEEKVVNEGENEGQEKLVEQEERRITYDEQPRRRTLVVHSYNQSNCFFKGRKDIGRAGRYGALYREGPACQVYTENTGQHALHRFYDLEKFVEGNWSDVREEIVETKAFKTMNAKYFNFLYNWLGFLRNEGGEEEEEAYDRWVQLFVNAKGKNWDNQDLLELEDPPNNNALLEEEEEQGEEAAVEQLPGEESFSQGLDEDFVEDWEDEHVITSSLIKEDEHVILNFLVKEDGEADGERSAELIKGTSEEEQGLDGEGATLNAEEENTPSLERVGEGGQEVSHVEDKGEPAQKSQGSGVGEETVRNDDLALKLEEHLVKPVEKSPIKGQDAVVGKKGKKEVRKSTNAVNRPLTKRRSGVYKTGKNAYIKGEKKENSKEEEKGFWRKHWGCVLGSAAVAALSALVTYWRTKLSKPQDTSLLGEDNQGV